MLEQVAHEQMDAGSSALRTLRFEGGTIQAVLDSQGIGWMALKPACVALGVDFEAQRQRLERCAWSVACVMQATGADAKRYRMYCLRADRVAMWLATIDTARVRPALRVMLEIWQCRAADALHAWSKQHAADGAVDPPDQQRLSAQQETSIRAIVRDELRSLDAKRVPKPKEHLFESLSEGCQEVAEAQTFVLEQFSAAMGHAGRAFSATELLAKLNSCEREALEKHVVVLCSGEPSQSLARTLGYVMRELNRADLPGWQLRSVRRGQTGMRWVVKRMERPN